MILISYKNESLKLNNGQTIAFHYIQHLQFPLGCDKTHRTFGHVGLCKNSLFNSIKTSEDHLLYMSKELHMLHKRILAA